MIAIFAINICYSQQNLSTLQKAAGAGYTVYTKSNGGQQYMLFATALDTTGIYDYIDSLFNLVAGQNGIISALPLGNVSIVADESNFLIDSLNLVRFLSRTNSGTAQSTFFQSTSLAAPTILRVISPNDTNIVARIQLDADGQSIFEGNNAVFKTKIGSGTLNLQLSDVPYITISDSIGFGIKFYEKYQFPNDNPSDGDVIVFNADGSSQFSSFPSGVNIYNSDGVQTDGIRQYDGDNGTLSFINMLLMTIQGALEVTYVHNKFEINASGIRFDLGDDLPLEVEDNRSNQIGITYYDDYCSTILANTRSIPDVGCVAQMISDSLLSGTANIYNSDGVTTDAIRTVDVSNTIQFVDTPTNGFGVKIITPLFSEEISLGRLSSTTGTRLTLVESKNSVELRGEAGNPASFLFLEETNQGANYAAIKARDTITSNVSFILPNSNGSYGSVLITDGQGRTSWDNSSNSTPTIYSDDDTIQSSLRKVYISDALNFQLSGNDSLGVFINPANDNYTFGNQYMKTTSFRIDADNNNFDFSGKTTSASNLNFREAPNNGTNQFTLSMPDNISSNFTWNLPASNAGGVFKNDGSGNLSWDSSIRSVVSGRVIAGTTSAGGTITVSLEGTPQVGYCVVSGNTISGLESSYIYSVSYTTGDTATVGVFDVMGWGTPCGGCTVSFSVICR